MYCNVFFRLEQRGNALQFMNLMLQRQEGKEEKELGSLVSAEFKHADATPVAGHVLVLLM